VTANYYVITEKRISRFYSDVDDKSGAQRCRNLLAMDNGKEPIEIHLTTDGGIISNAHAIVQTMRMCKSEIIVLGVGNVYSAGTIMIQGASPGCRYARRKIRSSSCTSRAPISPPTGDRWTSSTTNSTSASGRWNSSTNPSTTTWG
jgi:ATP-dependent protease ClpP protease subunit